MDQWVFFAIIVVLALGVVMVRRVPGPAGPPGHIGPPGPPVDTSELLKVIASEFPDTARKILPEVLPKFLPALIPAPIPGQPGERGLRGERGIPGEGLMPEPAAVEAVVKEQVNHFLQSLVPKLIPGPPGETGVGEKGEKGDAGPPPTKEQIDEAVSRLLPSLIPEPIPGPPGDRGPIGLPASTDGAAPAVLAADSGKPTRQAGRWSHRVRVEPWIFLGPELPIEARVGDLWVDTKTEKGRPLLMICIADSPISWVEV